MKSQCSRKEIATGKDTYKRPPLLHMIANVSCVWTMDEITSIFVPSAHSLIHGPLLLSPCFLHYHDTSVGVLPKTFSRPGSPRYHTRKQVERDKKYSTFMTSSLVCNSVTWRWYRCHKRRADCPSIPLLTL